MCSPDKTHPRNAGAATRPADSIVRPAAPITMGRVLMLGAMLLAPLTAILTWPGQAQEGGTAMTGAFADLEPGGRAAALGGAMGAVVDDPSAMYYNPAQLVTLEENAVVATYADLFGLGLVHHTSVFVGLPKFARHLSWEQGQLEARRGRVTTAYGLAVQATQVDLEPESYGEYDVAFALARHGKWGVRYGLAAHYLIIRSDLDATSATGYALDFGLAGGIGTGLEASILLRSLWSSLGWENNDDETLVPRAQFGLSWRPTRCILVPIEAVYDLERSHLQRLAGGIEWHPAGPALALRAGVRHIDDGESVEILPSGGIGLLWRQIAFDYGMAFGREELGDTQRFSLGYQF